VAGGNGESRHRAQGKQKNYNFLNIIHGGISFEFLFGCKLALLALPLDESSIRRSPVSHNADRNTSFLSIAEPFARDIRVAVKDDA
jgi:hypothetical protein